MKESKKRVKRQSMPSEKWSMKLTTTSNFSRNKSLKSLRISDFTRTCLIPQCLVRVILALERREVQEVKQGVRLRKTTVEQPEFVQTFKIRTLRHLCLSHKRGLAAYLGPLKVESSQMLSISIYFPLERPERMLRGLTS